MPRFNGGKCSEFIAHGTIKLSGPRTSTLYLLNPHKRTVERVQVDGCAITEGCRCDWMVVLEDAISNEELFVELKGSGVYHAVEQLQVTIETLSENAASFPKRSFVVFNRNPMYGTDVQRYKKTFRRDFNSEFDLKRNGSEIQL